ncbi:ASCH domain-containing protein [Ralstonia insidiosa]|jgi:hypothetical protein|nr:hypothetical protein [Ralstonia insidiosa]MBA9939242.1 hypothetical protein [Ralstonia insidiosa]MBC9968013.1 hypothetical protein [Ralstonia insidiosa]MBX3904424.1 hypothetical protein [Ralstonia insidiosa]
MKAISIWQPHASLLMLGLKPYETRGWPIPRSILGTRVAIHAAKADGDLREIAGYVLDHQAGLGEDERMAAYVRAVSSAGFSTLAEMPRGCILGSVVLSECVPAQSAENHNNFGDFSPGRFAWRASEPVLLPTPVPFRGMQGFFDVPSDLLTEVARRVNSHV